MNNYKIPLWSSTYNVLSELISRKLPYQIMPGYDNCYITDIRNLTSEERMLIKLAHPDWKGLYAEL